MSALRSYEDVKSIVSSTCQKVNTNSKNNKPIEKEQLANNTPKYIITARKAAPKAAPKPAPKLLDAKQAKDLKAKISKIIPKAFFISCKVMCKKNQLYH